MMLTIPEMFVVIQILYPLQFGTREQDCVLVKQAGIWSGYKFSQWMCNRKTNDVQLEADRQRLDYRNFMDDEEVMLLHHKRDMDVPDNPGSGFP